MEEKEKMHIIFLEGYQTKSGKPELLIFKPNIDFFVRRNNLPYKVSFKYDALYLIRVLENDDVKLLELRLDKDSKPYFIYQFLGTEEIFQLHELDIFKAEEV